MREGEGEEMGEANVPGGGGTSLQDGWGVGSSGGSNTWRGTVTVTCGMRVCV